MTPDGAKQYFKDIWIQKSKALLFDLQTLGNLPGSLQAEICALLEEAGGYDEKESSKTPLRWPEAENKNKEWCGVCQDTRLTYHVCYPMCLGCSDRLTKDEYALYRPYCRVCSEPRL